MQSGILIIDKPVDYTSRDVVNIVGKKFHTKKVGHTGTLDPLATGVLVVTLGKYTKLNDVLTSTYKEYIATMQLGIKADTLDITGNIQEIKEVNLNELTIKEGILHFKGIYNQEVPLYSAVKVNGKKLYEYAREGLDITLPKKNVEIKNIEIISIKENIVTFKVLVSKGTYIRSLIRDIGEFLNVGATMTALRRTKQGIFTIENAISLEELDNNKYQLLDIPDFLDVEIVSVTPELHHRVINGSKINYETNREFILFTNGDNNIALYKKDKDIYRMFIKLI